MSKFSKAIRTTAHIAVLCPVTIAMGTYMLFARKRLFEQFL